ncbi:hypothetical protein TWF102_006995 [Orbilia oligospora]|uniref:Uncharacterized protein n=1 Tax=Orbilia oligospora TaxID=2813651 RepID=A0A7C8NVP9_ORBOL|nr:hypothetical protein TWF103_005869 [Orbilia oligospora]KAF3111322.1 hypothetical protein TWF102_006995 [Orbilia oligospora]
MSQYIPVNPRTNKKRTISNIVDDLVAARAEEIELNTPNHRAELHDHFHYRLGQLYQRFYGSRYIPDRTKISYRVMNYLAQDLVDEYINETCAESEECWAQICNPRSMKALIKSKFYPMSVMFDEILLFRTSIPEKHASTKINVTYTGKRFVVSKIGPEDTNSGRKRKAEDSEASEWEDNDESDTDSDDESSSAAGESLEKEN